jgi:hypothetical protein
LTGASAVPIGHQYIEVMTHMQTKPKETPSVIVAKNMLPSELHPNLDELLEDYRFAALKHHGREWVSPKVLAELILMGWRASAPPVREE